MERRQRGAGEGIGKFIWSPRSPNINLERDQSAGELRRLIRCCFTQNDTPRQQRDYQLEFSLRAAQSTDTLVANNF